MPNQSLKPDDILKRNEVASLFGVNPRTVTSWAKNGRLPSFRTLGGHRRFRGADIIPLFNSNDTPTP